MADQTVNQPAPDHLNGYAPYHIKEVFENIAVKAEVLRDYLKHTRQTAEEHTMAVSNDLYMAQSMAAFIGAIADQMSGNILLGSPASWATGDGINPD